ncbi:MAG: guanylate kinase [Bacteroidales bacterium]|nr:guanylate kinase [Bacteroidales bacterium]
MKGKLIIFSAPSGAGKTTIVKQMLDLELNLEFSISACTREKRFNEINGKDYYFISVQEFKKKIKENEFIEWEEVYEGVFYGTLKSEINRITDKGKNVVFDIDVKGGINIKNLYKDDALSIFVMPPSIKHLEERLKNRSTDSLETIKKRLRKAELELQYADRFDRVIINDNLEKAVKEAKNTILEFLEK